MADTQARPCGSRNPPFSVGLFPSPLILLSASLSAVFPVLHSGLLEFLLTSAKLLGFSTSGSFWLPLQFSNSFCDYYFFFLSVILKKKV